MNDEKDTPRRGFLAGVLAACVMTAVMAVLRLTTDVLSVPEIVGEGIIGLMPAAVFSAVLDVMQRAAKPTLYVGIFIGQLLVGGLLGRWYAGGETSWPRALKLGAVVWLVFGVVVLPVLGIGLFGSAVRAGPVVVGAQLLVIFLSFAAALKLTYPVLTSLAAGREQEAWADRRAALATLGAGVAIIAAGGYGWRMLLGKDEAAPAPAASEAPPAAPPSSAGSGASSAAPAAQAPAPAAAAPPPPAISLTGPARIPPLDAPPVPMTVPPKAPAPAPFDVPGLVPEVMKAEDFYTVSKNLIDPKVELATWKLTIDGLVERPMTLTFDDIKSRRIHSDYYSLQCISNPIGGDLWGNAHWTGIRLVELLGEAGLKAGVRKVVFHAADDYTDSIVLDAALRPDTLLAYEMNGEPLTKDHGYPARLLIPGIYGMKNVKWITRIELVDYDFKGYWMQRGWSDPAPYQTSSRIDAPINRATLPVGEVTFGGVAFAGVRGIDTVEVSLDNGQSWQAAELKPALSHNAWNLWVYRRNLDNGTYQVKVRATDLTGQVQVAKETDPLPDGATGYHSILVRVG